MLVIKIPIEFVKISISEGDLFGTKYWCISSESPYKIAIVIAISISGLLYSPFVREIIKNKYRYENAVKW